MDTSPTPAPDTARAATPRPGDTSAANGPGSGDRDGNGPGSRDRDGSANSATTTSRTTSGARRATAGRKPTAGRAATPRNIVEDREATPRDDLPDTPDTAGPAPAGRRRRTLLLLLGLTAVTSATALVLGLLSWAPDPPEPTRPLTVSESERLAAVRVTNLRDLRAGVRVTAGTDAARIELVGWVDWSRSLLYVDVGGPGAGAERGLLQKSGPVLVIRPDPTAVPTPAAPPLMPPADRWRLHRLAPGAHLAPVLDLLLDLAADRPDPTGTAPSQRGSLDRPGHRAGRPTGRHRGATAHRRAGRQHGARHPQRRDAGHRTDRPGTGSTRTPGCTSW